MRLIECQRGVYDEKGQIYFPERILATELPLTTECAMSTRKPTVDNTRLDRIVAEARRAAEQRDKGYREQALKMYPWVCGRCGREFTRANLQELTVHHRNHNHDDNPADGSNWELLCVYCHDNEHSRYIDHTGISAASAEEAPAAATSNPFANLKALLKRDD